MARAARRAWSAAAAWSSRNAATSLTLTASRGAPATSRASTPRSWRRSNLISPAVSRTACTSRDEAHLDPRAALSSLGQRLEGLGGRIRFGVEAVARSIPGTVIDCRGLAARDRLSRPARREGRDAYGPLPRRGASAGPCGCCIRASRSISYPAASSCSWWGHHDRERRSWSRHRPFVGRAAERRLRAAPGLRRGRDHGAGLRCAAGLSRQPATHPPRGDTLLVNGLYRHGFLLAPALARRMASMVLEGIEFREVMDENHREQ